MKNLLFITSEFPPLPGGIGNHALHLALSLQKKDKKITVITDQRSKVLQDDNFYDKQLPFEVVRIKREYFVLITYLKRLFCSINFLIKNRDFAIISSGKFSLWIGAFLKLFFTKSKNYAILHGSEINAGGVISKAITKWSLSKFDKLIAVSNFTKELALEKNKNLKITVVNNGFSFQKEENLRVKNSIKGKPAIVTVGNVTLRKGQQNVINALPKLKQNFPEIHYHIIGIPTNKLQFEAFAKSLNVTENVTFHGALSNSDLQEVVSQSKVFFMLSDVLKNGDVEGFGIAVLEANFLGLPAIGSSNSGIVDAIKDKYSGIVVHPHDTSQVSTAFLEIMNNYNQYQENAIQWSKEFDWEIIIEKYMKIID